MKGTTAAMCMMLMGAAQADTCKVTLNTYGDAKCETVNGESDFEIPTVCAAFDAERDAFYLDLEKYQANAQAALKKAQEEGTAAAI